MNRRTAHPVPGPKRAVSLLVGASALGAGAVAGSRLARRDPSSGASHRLLDGSWLGRTGRLARLGVKIGGDVAATGARKTFASAERREQLDREREYRNSQQIADELGEMKGALMKLGQMASYLDDGLPEPLRIALGQLQADTRPMSIDLARTTIEEELNSSLDDLFVECDPDPIAAASIGQVHRAIAVLPPFGDPAGRPVEQAVAVKVQYPGVGDAIASDLRNADMLGLLLKQAFGGLDPTEMVDEIKLRLAEETDYLLEADNQARFAEFYDGHPFIRIPRVVDSMSTRRVLTTELVDGARWDEMMTWGQDARDRVGETIFRFVFRSLYRFGAFNGDPHPGNYLFHPDGGVTFLDFGLVKHFTTDEMSTFASMVKAAAHDKDPDEFRRIVERVGMLHPDAPVDTDDVGEYFSLFYATVAEDREMQWTREYANQIVRHTFDRTSPISQYATVPRSFVFIQRINLGLYALLGELGARGNYRRIASELWPFVDAGPSSELGHREADWLAGRSADQRRLTGVTPAAASR